MLYLIGGPGRSGKTTLAMRLTARHGIPYFSTDYLMMGLHHGVPGLRIDPGRPEHEVATLMQPVLRPLLTAMLENGEEYCVEGFAVTPELIAGLREQFHDSIRACCLGYCTADPAARLEAERKHRTTNPWPRELDHEEAISAFSVFIDASQTIRDACSRLDIEFFDTSTDVTETITSAERWLSS